MRIIVTATAICMSVIGLSVADDVHASIKKPTNIPAQSLAPALQALAKDLNFQIIYISEEIGDRRTDGAVGEYTPEEALKQLLKGTGLTYKYLDDNTITVVSPAAASASRALPRLRGEPGESVAQDESKPQEARSSSFWDRFRVAQASQGGSEQSASVGNDSGAKASRESSIRLEEVIVTAQKREERLQDVPISIVAVTADEIAKRKVTTIDDLQFVVPGLAMSTSGVNRRIVLRGIGNSFGSSSLIGLYLDEATATSFPSVQLDLRTYDLERVEVLRGPQGTLYGEGSVGGTIRFITKSPQLHQFALTGDVASLFTEGGAPSQRIETAVNLPIVDSKLGIRVAGTFDHEGGWVDQPQINAKNFNDQNVTDVRIKGLWLPTQKFTVNAMAVIHRSDGSPNIGENSDGTYAQVGQFLTTPHKDDDYDLFNVTLSYDLPIAQLLSTTTYLKQDLNEANIGNSLPLDGPIGTAPLHEQYFDTMLSIKSFTQELRLTSIGAGPAKWTIGGFYRRFRNGSYYPDFYSGKEGTPLTNFGVFGPYANQSKSSAAFGDFSYQALERLTLGAGLRYFHDDQDQALPVHNGSFHSVNPRAYAELKVSDAVNAYASAAKGFRSGGFNFGPGLPAYGPESVWTYELGTKMLLRDARMSIDSAVFLSNYTNYQVVGLDPNNLNYGDITKNAGDARIKGIETAVTWRPADSWNLSLSGDYLHTEFTAIKLLPSSSSYQVGDPLDLIPKYQFTASVEREFVLQSKPGFVRLDYNQQGRSNYRNRSFGPWYHSESDVNKLLNLNTSIDYTPNLSLGFFAQNLLNDRGFTSSNPIERLALRSRPRTFGVNFSVRFE